MRALLATVILIITPAFAADTVDDGWNAYESRDFDTALAIFQRLADEGNDSAQFNLARMYDAGHGVEADPGEALRWYRLAAQQGHRTAQFVMGLKYHRGDGVAKDVAEAARWYELSARQGYPGAQLNLGGLYATGEGVPRDEVRALAWWTLAADRGNPLAIRNRTALADQLGPTRVEEAERLARSLPVE